LSEASAEAAAHGAEAARESGALSIRQGGTKKQLVGKRFRAEGERMLDFGRFS
jgi:hypothetical protein